MIYKFKNIQKDRTFVSMEIEIKENGINFYIYEEGEEDSCVGTQEMEISFDDFKKLKNILENNNVK